MKKSLILTGLIILSTGLLAQNALKNPSFEDMDPQKPDLPAHWSTKQVHSLAKHHFVDREHAFDGKQSVKLTNDNPALDIKSYMLWLQSGVAQALNECPPGTPMVFSVYARADSPDVRVRIYFESMNEDRIAGNVIGTPQAPAVGEWKQIVLKFNMPEKKFTSAYVCLQLLTTGTVWFDQAYLGKAADAPKEVVKTTDDTGNIILNPSIELLGNSGAPANWTPFQLNYKNGVHSVDKTSAFSGANSLKISCDDPAVSANHFVMWRQDGLAPRLADCAPDTLMELAVRANTGSNPSVKFRFYIEMRAKGKFIGTFISPPQSIYFGWEKKTLRFKMPAEAPDSAYVCLQLLTPGTVWFDDVWLGKAAQAPVEKTVAAYKATDYFCRAENLPPRQTYYLPEVPAKLKLQHQLPAGSSLSVTLRDINGGTVKSWARPGAEIDLPPLGKGTYELFYQAGDFSDSDLFRIVEKSGKGVSFSADHRMFIDGKPFFPIVIVTPAMTEEAIRVYGAAGANAIAFSSMTANPPAARYLADTAAKHGLKVISWSNFGDRHQYTDARMNETLDAEIAVARQLDNFIGWLDDESEHRQIPLASLRRVYRKLFADAPEFIFWQNHAPRMTDTAKEHESAASVRKYSRLADVTGLDIYPVPEGGNHSNLANKTISCIGEYTDLAMASGFGQKPIWMVLQASSWPEFYGKAPTEAQPRPTYEQFRFMVYNAVTHGATGIALFGGLGDIYSPYMAQLADILKELGAISPFLLSGQTAPVKDALPPGVAVKVYRDRDDFLVIAVNENKTPVTFAFTPPATGRQWHQLPAGQQSSVQQVGLAGEEVKILSTRAIAIPPTPVFRAAAASGSDRGSLTELKWTAQWVAHPKFFRAGNKTTFARQSVKLPAKPTRCDFRITGDDEWQLSVNGQSVGRGYTHNTVLQYNIAKYLKEGDNLLEFELHNLIGPSGLLFEGAARTVAGDIVIASGSQTMFSENGQDGWTAPHLAGSPPTAPWGPLTLLAKVTE